MDALRDQRGLPALDAAVTGLASLPKLLAHHRAYFAFATVTIAAAVGLNLIVFTIVNALWLRPPPFPDADRLVQLIPTFLGVGSLDSPLVTDTMPHPFAAVAPSRRIPRRTTRRGAGGQDPRRRPHGRLRSAPSRVSLLLGVGGVFGLVANLAESRRREFAVRLALGATHGALVRKGLAAALCRSPSAQPPDLSLPAGPRASSGRC